MKNNSHMESKQQRLKRLESGPPTEAIDTLLNSIANFFNNEIVLTPDSHQTSLLFIGIHASILTISEALFGKSGKDGFKIFLEKFVDGDAEDTQFSKIAHVLHNWRNILAHQWIGSLGHEIEYDYQQTLGWQQTEIGLKINPKIYCERYMTAFSSSGRLWDYEDVLTPEELKKAKERIIEKYKKR